MKRFSPDWHPEIRSPLQHQLALIQMFRFMDIRRPHRIAFHMAHLPFHRILRS
ncbi:hypothetical protein HMPREF9549_02289 [Escherichia coli MS 185-1]|nr:hypothetical protein HMPREF9549_02289 [Escherichia coli MS 185-1]EFJ94232.1 hypothetical protein HMPREF9531_00640 [Escherichia coli MS 45-1]ESD34404.1 hypothetical protein HMPREF1603_04201 [Escherichia coli 907892]